MMYFNQTNKYSLSYNTIYACALSSLNRDVHRVYSDCNSVFYIELANYNFKTEQNLVGI